MTRFCSFLALAVAMAGCASAQTNQWTTNWTPLFDGKTLNHWASTDFAGHGDVTVDNGQIKIKMGADLSGITWTNGPLPLTNYEISLQAVKLDGSDFFCGLTFPVAKSSCSLILGGWGGGIVGLSSIDDADASENDTTRSMAFDTGHWYHIVVRVTPAKIEAWLDDKKIIDASIAGRKVSLRPGPIYLSQPLGVATYETTSGLKDFKLRLIEN
jgi:3-keto-disaccharide hydrolase